MQLFNLNKKVVPLDNRFIQQSQGEIGLTAQHIVFFYFNL